MQAELHRYNGWTEVNEHGKAVALASASLPVSSKKISMEITHGTSKFIP
jgi:hypothetical protein